MGAAFTGVVYRGREPGGWAKRACVLTDACSLTTPDRIPDSAAWPVLKIRNDDASTTCQAAAPVAGLPPGRGHDGVRAARRQHAGARAGPAEGPAAHPRRRDRAAAAR